MRCVCLTRSDGMECRSGVGVRMGMNESARVPFEDVSGSACRRFACAECFAGGCGPDAAFMPSDGQFSKLANLEEQLAAMGKLAIAFSGGVDSSFLLAVARKVLEDKVIAITNKSPLVPEREHDLAVRICNDLAVRQLVLEACDLDDPAFAENPADRCYLCKRRLLGEIMRVAEAQGFPHVAEGSNVDDCSDYRPGFRAVRELGVESPLLQAGLSKQDIRDLSHWMGLPTWDKPSFACLASRFPYGDPITEEKLARVGEAEQFLLDSGVSNVRVRVHGDVARIEVLPQDMETVLANRDAVVGRFRALGYSFVALDLQGYRMGSMNGTLAGD